MKYIFVLVYIVVATFFTAYTVREACEFNWAENGPEHIFLGMIWPLVFVWKIANIVFDLILGQKN